MKPCLYCLSRLHEEQEHDMVSFEVWVLMANVCVLRVFASVWYLRLHQTLSSILRLEDDYGLGDCAR